MYNSIYLLEDTKVTSQTGVWISDRDYLLIPISKSSAQEIKIIFPILGESTITVLTYPQQYGLHCLHIAIFKWKFLWAWIQLILDEPMKH